MELTILKVKRSDGSQFHHSTDCHVVRDKPISIDQAFPSVLYASSGECTKLSFRATNHVVLDLAKGKVLSSRDNLTGRVHSNT